VAGEFAILPLGAWDIGIGTGSFIEPVTLSAYAWDIEPARHPAGPR
jgi:hypothetical protein